MIALIALLLSVPVTPAGETVTSVSVQGAVAQEIPEGFGLDKESATGIDWDSVSTIEAPFEHLISPWGTVAPEYQWKLEPIHIGSTNGKCNAKTGW